MAEEEMEVELCLTCKQNVPIKNLQVHAIHCKRFLTQCPHCKDSVHKDDLEQHIEENHTKIKCTDCKENVEKMELEDHKEKHCRSRIVTCSYCEITLPACDIDEHKEQCGSRTEECETCKKRILIKELELHISEGCQPPGDPVVERNGTSSVNARTNKPKSLYYDNANHRNGFNSGGTGFQISSQFSYSTFTNQSEVNSYVDHNRDNDHRFRNSFLPESMGPTETVEQQKSMQFPAGRSFDKKTLSNSQWVNRKPRKDPNTFDKPLEDKSWKPKIQRETDSKKRLSVESDELPEFGIPDQNSDDDDYMSTAGPPELTDDTFLPCEFCDESFPADSLVVHQAMCQEMPPTPRPTKQTFFNRPPLNSPHVPEQNYSFSEPPQARGGISKPMMQDIDDNSIPCEFCCEPFPVDDIAVHQTSCSLNPLYLDKSSQSSSTREQRRAKSPSPKPQTLPSEPKIHPPALVSPHTHTPESSTVRPPRHNVTLAPTFSNRPAPTPSVTGARPKTTISKPKGGGRKRLKPVHTAPRNFQEINVLGGDSPRQDTTFEPRSTNVAGRESSGNVLSWEQDIGQELEAIPPAFRTRNGRGNVRFGRGSSSQPRSRGKRGHASSSLYSNDTCTDSLDGFRGGARGSAGARRSSAGSRRRGQSRRPLNGPNSFMQRGRAGQLQLNGRGLEGRRAVPGNELEGGLERSSVAASRGGHRLGGSDARGTRGARGGNPSFY